MVSGIISQAYGPGTGAVRSSVGDGQTVHPGSTPHDHEPGEIRLRADRKAPLSLQFEGDMEGRTLRLVPGENGMTEVVIGSSREVSETNTAELPQPRERDMSKKTASDATASDREQAHRKVLDTEVLLIPVPNLKGEVQGPSETVEERPGVNSNWSQWANSGANWGAGPDQDWLRAHAGGAKDSSIKPNDIRTRENDFDTGKPIHEAGPHRTPCVEDYYSDESLGDWVPREEAPKVDENSAEDNRRERSPKRR
jgi:hypothetical protein